MKQIIKLTEADLHNIIKESVEILLNENDRHKPGYWAERWAKQKANGTTPSGDRHRPDYFKGRADRHKPGYYKKYNLQHPERLERIGIDPDYIQRVKEFHDCNDLGDEDDVAMAQISLDPSCYDDIYEGKSGIHIDPENKGKFTATKKATGKSTEELTHSKNSLTKKRAIFAQNAKRWNHKKKG